MTHIHVLIATPLGRNGKGGIDRVTDNILATLAKNPNQNLTASSGATRGGGHIALSPLFLLVFIARMIVLRLLGRCDVVHINVTWRGSTWRKLIVAKVAHRLRIPYIVHLHGGRYPEFLGEIGPFLRSHVDWLFQNATRVLTLGSVWRLFVLDNKLAEPERVGIIHNATAIQSTQRRSGSNGRICILFLGLLGPNKGTPQLVEALARLKDRSDWQATLAGNGEVDRTRAEIERRGIHHCVSVPGWIEPEVTERLLAESDILVLPSFAENLPMSVIEGMAAGLAVVTTPVGATPDIIRDGETGLLVPPGDVDALAAALEKLIGDEPLRRRLGDAARIFHRKHLEIGAYTERLSGVWRETAL